MLADSGHRCGVARRRGLWVAALLGLAWAGIATWSTPAQAHPGGLPTVITLSAEDSTLTGRWEAPPDDARVLESHTGDVAAYLSDRVMVRQSGQPCSATVSLVSGGAADMTFTCPGTIDVVEVEVTILLDVDTTYQTLALADVAQGPDRALFTGGTTRRSFDFRQGGESVEVGAVEPPEVISGTLAPTFERRFIAVASGPLSLAALVGSLALAFAVGAAHALAPGHGKSIAAAYLVAERGRVRDAVGLGAAVAAMHTASVLGLGLLTFTVTRSAALTRVLPTLSLIAALGVLVVGVVMVVQRVRPRPEGHDHAHPLSGAGLAAIAASGGLLPSPSALAALLAAVAVGRTGLGLGLVAAFSLGLALAITAFGVAVLRGGDLLRRRVPGMLRWLPIAGAIAVLAAGLALTWAAAQRL